MNRIILKLNLLAIIIMLTSNNIGQELKKITRKTLNDGEIYFVLKSDKNIKQGPFLKYFESVSLDDKAVDSYGNYDNNKKTGVWVFCDGTLPMNPLIALGEYSNDKKNGKWIFFYSPVIKDPGNSLFVNYKKLTRVTLPVKDEQEFHISIDTIGIIAASTGDYVDNKKVGIWDYYSRFGTLAIKYDFTENRLIYVNGHVGFEQMGGFDRFRWLTSMSAIGEISKQSVTKGATVTLEIATFQDSLSIQRLNMSGGPAFARIIENTIKTMPYDWLNYDPRLEQNKIRVFVNYQIDGFLGKVSVDTIAPQLYIEYK